MKRLKNSVLYHLYPPKCIFCRTPLPRDAMSAVCADCANDLPYCLSAPHCKVCGKPMAVETQSRTCLKCRRDIYRPYKKIRSVFVYEDSVRDAVVRYKATANAYYGAAFAEYLTALVEATFAGVHFDGVVAVAPRRKRMRKSGLDQAAYLAQLLAKSIDVPFYDHVLFQKESRKKQSDLGYVERFENMRGNVGVRRPKVVSGRCILLVDDVCTTSASLRENASVLRSAGATAVYGITVATVPQSGY